MHSGIRGCGRGRRISRTNKIEPPSNALPDGNGKRPQPRQLLRKPGKDAGGPPPKKKFVLGVTFLSLGGAYRFTNAEKRSCIACAASLSTEAEDHRPMFAGSLMKEG
jgi:hypothetical protein